MNTINIDDKEYPTHPEFDKYYGIYDSLLGELDRLLSFFKDNTEQDPTGERVSYLEEAIGRIYKFECFVDQSACPEAFRDDIDEEDRF